MKRGVQVVPWSSQALLVTPEDRIIRKPSSATELASLSDNYSHVCQHVGNPFRVGLGHYGSICCKRGDPGQQGAVSSDLPFSQQFSAKAMLSGSSSLISANSMAWIRLTNLAGTGVKLDESLNAEGLGVPVSVPLLPPLIGIVAFGRERGRSCCDQPRPACYSHRGRNKWNRRQREG